MAEGKKWFLYGCLGCLGVVILMLLVAATVAGVAMIQVGNEQVERHVATQEVPGRDDPDTEEPIALEPPSGVGRVLLELSRGEFEIKTLPSGEPLRVEARYDKNSYELIESLELEESGDWTYHVRFRATVSMLMGALRQMFGGDSPKVEIFLPTNVPMSLDFALDQGGGSLDLGGLWLTEVDLRLNKGGFQIDVDEPLQRPVERFALHGSMGGMVVSRLGNASPRRLDVEFGMGGLELDLRGEWVTDSDIRISTSMGGTVLRLPRNVRIEGLDRGGIRPLQEPEIAPPTLRFDLSTNRGELEIVD